MPSASRRDRGSISNAHTQVAARGNPAVHHFRTADHRYVLDINTNEIIEVDEAAEELLRSGLPEPSRAALARLETRYPRGAILARLRAVKRAQKEKGVFLPARVERIRPRHSLPEVRRLLARRLSQLELCVTENCNLRCRYCVYSGKYRYARTRSARNMPFETARKAINYFMAHSGDSAVRCISFYGGEPMLRKGFVRRCVEYALDQSSGRKVLFGLTTNGTLLTEEFAEFLRDHNFTLTVSLDGPRRIHDGNRIFASGAGSFARVMESVRMICKRFPDFARKKLSFSTVIPPGASMVEMNRFFSEELPAPARRAPVSCGFVDRRDTTYFQEVGPSRWEDHEWEKLRGMYVKAISEGRVGQEGKRPFFPLLDREILKELGQLYRRGLFASLPKSASPGGQCVPGVRKLFVSVEGKYLACEKAEPRGEAACIGHVDSGIDTRRAWDLLASYTRLNADECLSCWAIRLCSQCCVAAIRGNGLDPDRKRRFCRITRERIHEGLVLMASILERNERALDFLENVTFG